MKYQTTGKIRASSDWHLGVTTCYEAIKTFLIDAMNKDDVSAVVLCGDILELQNSDFPSIISYEKSAECYFLLKDLATQKHVFLVLGNHEGDLGEFLRHRLYPINVIYDKLELNDFTFLHGHQPEFDFTTPFVKSLLSPIRGFLPLIYRKFYGTPSELKKYNPKKYDWASNEINRKIFNYALENKKNVVFGHTHRPFVATFPNEIIVANCGDMQTELSFLEIDNKKIKLYIENKVYTTLT